MKNKNEDSYKISRHALGFASQLYVVSSGQVRLGNIPSFLLQTQRYRPPAGGRYDIVIRISIQKKAPDSAFF